MLWLLGDFQHNFFLICKNSFDFPHFELKNDILNQFTASKYFV